MTLDQIMDLQYRKLLTARERFWAEMEEDWNNEQLDEAAFHLGTVGVLMLLDLERMELEELGAEEKDFLGPLVEMILESEDADDAVILPYDVRQAIMAVLAQKRIPDEWNRALAVHAVDFVNAVMPILFIGKDHLESIL